MLGDALERLRDDDDRLALLTVTGVSTDPDLRHATVFLASLPTGALPALEARRLALQAAIAREVRLKGPCSPTDPTGPRDPTDPTGPRNWTGPRDQRGPAGRRGGESTTRAASLSSTSRLVGHPMTSSPAAAAFSAPGRWATPGHSTPTLPGS